MKEHLVLVPGIDGTGLLFYWQIPSLSRSFEVTTTCHRDEARSMDDLVEDLDRAIAAAAPSRRVTLLGESFGGALTLSYALAHPERVERIVILNSFAHFGSQAGIYKLFAGSGAAEGALEFAANLSDLEESKITPQTTLAVAGIKATAPSGFASGPRREYWILLLLGAIALSVVEWFLYHRRVTV